ncbi:MAG: hypothetical protein L3J24_06040 [Xanthomonadales bacterium]|nr:hypothetical protein [Xanthomonadales bacterium]
MMNRFLVQVSLGLLLMASISLAMAAGSVTQAAGPKALFVVDTLVDESDGDFSPGDLSLREAVEQANLDAAADSISFAAALTGGGPATITLTLGEIQVTESVIITGPGQTLLTISGNNASRIFLLDDGNNSAFIDVGISGLSLINGHAMDAVVNGGQRGGAIRSIENLTLTDSTLSGNVADTHGGGVYSVLGTAVMDGLTFTGNMAGTDDGGGLFLDLGTLTLRNSLFSTNTAGDAGGGARMNLFRAQDSALIEDTVFDNNTATREDGGGLSVGGNGDLIVRNGSFTNNIAGEDGGGLSRFGGTTTIDGSDFSDNTIAGGGGGIVFFTGNHRMSNSTVSGNLATSNVFGGGGIYTRLATVRVEACTISGNTATRLFGGGIMKLDGTVAVLNSTISGNSANLDGGGIRNQSGTMNIVNSTVRGNTSSDDGGGVSRSGGTVNLRNTIVTGNNATGAGDEVEGSVTGDGNNLLGHSGRNNGQAFSGFTPGASDITATSNGTDPTTQANILDTTLADNGGPTLTHALAMSSPAQDAGDGSLATDDGMISGVPLLFDQRGFPRFAFTAVDIGALEVVDPMPVNLTDCSAISLADIGSPLSIPLAGNMGTMNFDVTYNGVTTTTIPPGNFTTTNNVVGNVATVTTRANGVDVMGNPASDEVVCNLDYSAPTTVCTQSPDSTVTPVDIGTVITLTQTATNTLSATAGGVPMALTAGTPNSVFGSVWEATHTAVADTNIAAVATNPDGDTGSCVWAIDIIRLLSVAVTPTSGLITTEAGGTDTFSVVLDQDPPLDNVTIALTSSDPDEGTVNPASLTFTPGNYDVPQTVTVTGVDDAIDDGDQGYIVVTGATMSPGDPEFDGIDPADVAVSNTDNDSAGITVTPTSGLTTTEAGGSANFSVVLDSEPLSDVSVALASSDDTEGMADAATLAFTAANWDTPQTVTVTGVDDAVVDGDQAYSITTAPAVSGDGSYSGFDAADVPLSNTDNDSAGITVTPTSGLTTTEAGGSANFSVVLDSEPLSDVSVALASSDTTEGMADAVTLAYTAANWDTPQTVTVTGVDDAVVDGDQAYSITTAPAVSGDGSYSGFDAADVSLSNTDGDTGGISINDASVVEGTGANTTATFTVTLDTAVDGGFTVDYSTADGSATAPGDYTAASSTLSFVGNLGETQTLAVSVIGDSDFEPDETYTVSLGAPSNPAVSATDGSGLGTIVDDDSASADLAIALSAAPDPVIAGTQLVYTAAVSNAGPSDAADVVVSLNLPAGTSFVSGSVAGGGSCSGAGPVVCSYSGPLLVGPGNARSATVTVDVAASQLTALSASAAVSTSTVDPVAANDSSAVTTAVNTSADLSMAMTIVPAAGGVGDFFVLSATASNSGPSDAADLAINIDVPQGLVIVSSSPSAGGMCSNALPASGSVLLSCGYAGPTVPGASRSVEALLQSAASGQIVVTATAASGTADPVANNQLATAAVGAAVQQIPTLQSAMLAMLALLMLSIGGLAIRTRD